MLTYAYSLALAQDDSHLAVALLSPKQPAQSNLQRVFALVRLTLDTPKGTQTMTKDYFWDADTSKIVAIFETILKAEISSEAKEVYDHIFETGVLWLDWTDGVVGFEFTDENFEFRKAFSLEEINFCGLEDEDGKAAVIAELHKLIKRVEALP